MICAVELSIVGIAVTTLSTITTLLIGVIAFWTKQFIKEQKEADIEIKNEIRTLSAQIIKNDIDTKNISENYKVMMENTKQRLDSHADKIDMLNTQVTGLVIRIGNCKEELTEMKTNCASHRKNKGE